MKMYSTSGAAVCASTVLACFLQQVRDQLYEKVDIGLRTVTGNRFTGRQLSGLPVSQDDRCHAMHTMPTPCPSLHTL